MSKRVVIVGGPNTGKTTYAKKLADNIKHTDDTIPMGWDQAIDHVASWMGKPEQPVIEGVQAVRGMRKWLADNPTGKPCDEVVWLQTPKEAQTRGQAIMNKGLDTVMKEIIPELERRGVEIVKKP